MDPLVARKTWRTLEPIHGFIYFAPEAARAYASIGLTSELGGGYFASRAAPMGPVAAEVVIATFFNFRPDFVRETIPLAWAIATPEQIVAARFDAAGAMLRRLLGDQAEGRHIEEASELARRAATDAAALPEGRPLFAGHASLDWPDDPLVALWHAQSMLREFRGDGHVAAMTADGVSGLEALIIHGATGDVPPAILRATRNWSVDEWASGEDGLRSRGWLDADGALTQAGRDHRQWVEDRTDALAVPAYVDLGVDGCERLRQLCRPLSRTVVSSGAFSGI